MEADDLLCSRNARSRTPLVGRAQWKINQPPSLRDNERAWKVWCRGMRSFLCSRSARPAKDGKGAARCHSCSQNAHDKKDGKDTHVGLCSRNARPEKGLVRRPHVDQHGCPSRGAREGKQASLEGSIKGWSFDARSKGQPRPLPPIKA